VTRGPRRAYASVRRLVSVPASRVAAVPPDRPGADLGATQARALVSAARRARANALAPYSKFAVGAAVLDERGRVHIGCNVENASYGLSLCAERSAVAAAVAAGAHRILAVAVVTAAQPAAPPCGACRQFLAEVAADDAVVLLASARGSAAPERWKLGDLLPRAFRM
jgi:cytidine deaminase